MAGRLRVWTRERGERDHSLGGTNLLGRHRSCSVGVGAPGVPAFWLELRWSERGWAWRELCGGEESRGGGAPLGEGWRELRAGRRIRRGEEAWVELLDESPPEVLLVDVLTGEERQGAELDAILEVGEGRVLPIHADGDPAAELHDGELLSDGRRTWRLLRPEVLTPTLRGGVLLTHPELSLELDVQARSASFVVGMSVCAVAGGPVLAMAPYALARRDGPRDEGGWLTLAEAHAWWVELGGAASSPAERLNWERAKLRSLLAREGARGVDTLFEVRRRVGETTIRLALEPERIDVRGEG